MHGEKSNTCLLISRSFSYPLCHIEKSNFAIFFEFYDYSTLMDDMIQRLVDYGYKVNREINQSKFFVYK